MQPREHLISVLLLRVIARRTQFVASHTMVFYPRFICHFIFASIFFAFYCSNGVRYKGNQNLHNEYISLDRTALAGSTAAVFCVFEPMLCSSILAAFMLVILYRRRNDYSKRSSKCHLLHTDVSSCFHFLPPFILLLRYSFASKVFLASVFSSSLSFTNVLNIVSKAQLFF